MLRNGRFLALFLIGLTFGACSPLKNKKGTKFYLLNAAGGKCLDMWKPAPIKVEDAKAWGVLEGNCPASTSVGGQTATVAKKCDTYKETSGMNAGETGQFSIYNKMLDDKGVLVNVSPEAAQAKCKELDDQLRQTGAR